MTACTRAFFGSQTWPGALTLSTVQFGSAAFGHRVQHQRDVCREAPFPRKLAGMVDFCMSLKKCSSMGVCTVSAMERRARASSPKLAARIAGLDAVDGGAQRAGVLRSAASAPGACEPSAITWARSAGLRDASTRERFALGVGQARARAHAEGIVDRPAAVSLSPFMLAAERLMNGLAKASASSRSTASRKRQQQQIAQAAMLDGALRAPLEEHQRAERARRGACGAAAGAR